MSHPIRTIGWVFALLVVGFFAFVYASLGILTGETA